MGNVNYIIPLQLFFRIGEKEKVIMGGRGGKDNEPFGDTGRLLGGLQSERHQ